MSGAPLLYDPATQLWTQANSTQGKQHTIGYLWDTVALSFVVPEKPTAGAGGDVNVTNWPVTQAVSGVFWQATQPVSASSLPLPTGAATEATLAKIPGLAIPLHDYMSLAQNATQDIWTYKTGGGGGTTVATLTITFTDATKTILSSIART